MTLVVGATGTQGGTVVDALLGDGREVAVGHPVEPEPVGFDAFAERTGAPEVFVRFL